jgi:hypothetical protein
VRTTNSGQFEQTLRELRRLGRIEKLDAAAVQAVRSMARALDEDPSRAALWRQYREALRELTADDTDDLSAAAAAELFAEVGDSPAS